MNKAVLALIVVGVVIIIATAFAALIFMYGKKRETDDTTDDFLCGKRYEHIQPRFITNGTDAPLGSAPWLVSIKLKIGTKDGRVIDSHNCGGSIISREWVLTATHCIGDANARDKCVKNCTVIAGSIKRNDTGYDFGSTHTIVQQIPFDKNYDLNNKDIALLKVSPPFEYRKPGNYGRRAIGPVCLPQAQDERITKTEGNIVGFGGTNDSFMQLYLKNKTKREKEEDIESFMERLLQLPQNLQSAHVNVVSRDECANVPDEYLEDDIRKEKKWREIIFDPKAIVCAGNLEEHKFGCHADSGGPLTVDNNGYATIVGITHLRLTPSCIVDPVWYTVFTKVSHFRDWITEKTGV